MEAYIKISCSKYARYQKYEFVFPTEHYIAFDA